MIVRDNHAIELGIKIYKAKQLLVHAQNTR